MTATRYPVIAPDLVDVSVNDQRSTSYLNSPDEMELSIKLWTLFSSMFEINSWPEFSRLINALVISFSVIVVSELGDKTFIITAIMAMKNSRSLVFLSSAFALLLMTALSVVMGLAVTVIPRLYTHYASIVLFLCFGFKMLQEAYYIDQEEGEFDEVKRSLEEGDLMKNEMKNSKLENQDTEAKGAGIWSKYAKTIYVAPILIKVFTMILVAEWGDRSQISTVILAARENSFGVFAGSLVGHVLCTGLAVIGGRFIADMISVRTMTFIGGITFLFFATFAIISGPE